MAAAQVNVNVHCYGIMVQSDSIANHTMWCYAYSGNHNLNNAHKMMNVTSVANSNNWLKIQLICSLESHYYYQCPVTTYNQFHLI